MYNRPKANLGETMTSNDDQEKDKDKETDIWSQPLSRANAKEACVAFLGECAGQLMLYGMMALIGTTIGTMIWVSIWFGVLLVPMVMTGYYLFKKYQNQNHEKI